MKRFFTLVLLTCISLSTFALGRLTGVLTQEMLDVSGSVFYVRADYTLTGATLTVPAGKTLVFVGGTLDNGEIVGSETAIRMMQSRPAFGVDLVISGTWNVPEVHDGWFLFDDSEGFVSNQIIKNILALSNDETPCHILFEEDRTYYFELPYDGRGDLGKLVSTRVEDGQEKRNYSDLYGDKFDYLRIFTIPSNTHLTVNNRLKMLPTSIGAYFIFWEYGKKNITIDGKGTIAGDNDWHRFDKPMIGNRYYGEWGHVFQCFRCSDFIFKDITISDSFGDCIIYIGSPLPNETENRWASRLLVENVKILGARRNGIAIGAKDVIIRNCHFENCGTDQVNGTTPRVGIDFEPDGWRSYPEVANENVLMENCSFVNNEYDCGASVNNVPGYGKTATIIRNCHFTSEVKFSAAYWVRLENCYIPALYKRPDRDDYISNYNEFVNCDFGESSAIVHGLFSKKGNKFTNCRFGVVKKD